MGQHILGRGTARPGGTRHNPRGQRGTLGGRGGGAGSAQERPGTRPTPHTGAKPSSSPAEGSPHVPRPAKHSPAPSGAGGHREPAAGAAGPSPAATSRTPLSWLFGQTMISWSKYSPSPPAPRGAFPARGRDAAPASVGARQAPLGTHPPHCPPWGEAAPPRAPGPAAATSWLPVAPRARGGTAGVPVRTGIVGRPTGMAGTGGHPHADPTAWCHQHPRDPLVGGSPCAPQASPGKLPEVLGGFNQDGKGGKEGGDSLVWEHPRSPARHPPGCTGACRARVRGCSVLQSEGTGSPQC